VHGDTVNDRVRRVDDHLIAGTESCKNLDTAAEISPLDNAFELNPILEIDRGDLRARCPKQHRSCRQAQGVGVAGEPEVHFSIGPREDLMPRVIQFELDLQSSQCRIQRVRGAHCGGCVGFTRLLTEFQFRLDSGLGCSCIRFGNLYIVPKLESDGHSKQFRTDALTGVDQCSDVGITRGNHPIERRYDALE